MSFHGPQFDPDGQVQHKPVSDVQTYRKVTTLWTRRLGQHGRCVCDLLSGDRHGKRIIRLTTEYHRDDELVVHVQTVQDELEEQAALFDLELRVRQAELAPKLAGGLPNSQISRR